MTPEVLMKVPLQSAQAISQTLGPTETNKSSRFESNS